jgi:hypothetical protein
MRDYWKAAFSWAKERTELLTWNKAWTSLGLAVATLVAQSSIGLRTWASVWLFAAATIVGYALVSVLSLVWNTIARAPVALDAARAEVETELKAEVYRLSGYGRVLGSLERREDDLRTWIPEYVTKKRDIHPWLKNVVPRGLNYKDYIEPLKAWAIRPQSDIEITAEDAESADVKFKIRQRWFDM